MKKKSSKTRPIGFRPGRLPAYSRVPRIPFYSPHNGFFPRYDFGGGIDDKQYIGGELGAAGIGALGGAAQGAQIGMNFGPYGAAIGAGAGLLLGGTSGYLGQRSKDKAEATLLNDQQRDFFRQQSLVQQHPYMADGSFIPNTRTKVINVEKGELQVNPKDGSIVTHYDNQPVHPEQGTDPAGNVVAGVGNFIIPKKYSKEYEQAAERMDKVKMRTMMTNIHREKVKKEAEEAKIQEKTMNKMENGGSLKKVLREYPPMNQGLYSYPIPVPFQDDLHVQQDNTFVNPKIAPQQGMQLRPVMKLESFMKTVKNLPPKEFKKRIVNEFKQTSSNLPEPAQYRKNGGFYQEGGPVDANGPTDKQSSIMHKFMKAIGRKGWGMGITPMFATGAYVGGQDPMQGLNVTKGSNGRILPERQMGDPNIPGSWYSQALPMYNNDLSQFQNYVAPERTLDSPVDNPLFDAYNNQWNPYNKGLNAKLDQNYPGNPIPENVYPASRIPSEPGFKMPVEDINKGTNAVGQALPTIYNLGQGLLGKPDLTDYRNYQLKNKMGYRDVNFDPIKRGIEQQANITRQNIKSASGGGAGAYLSNITQAGANTQNQLSNAMMEAQRYNNAGRQAADQFNIGLDQYNMNQRMSIEDRNARAKAKGSEYLGRGLEGVSGLTQRDTYQASQGKNQQDVLKMYQQLFPFLQQYGKLA